MQLSGKPGAGHCRTFTPPHWPGCCHLRSTTWFALSVMRKKAKGSGGVIGQYVIGIVRVYCDGGGRIRIEQPAKARFVCGQKQNAIWHSEHSSRRKLQTILP